MRIAGNTRASAILAERDERGGENRRAEIEACDIRERASEIARYLATRASGE